MNKKQARAAAGEDYTAVQLEKQGIKILERNFRRRGGEIDIIAEESGELVFVEVKTRKFGSMTDGADAVDRGKRKRIILTAVKFTEERELEGMPMRFDVSEITVTTEDCPGVLEWNYYRDAFDATGLDMYNIGSNRKE